MSRVPPPKPILADDIFQNSKKQPNFFWGKKYVKVSYHVKNEDVV